MALSFPVKPTCTYLSNSHVVQSHHLNRHSDRIITVPQSALTHRVETPSEHLMVVRQRQDMGITSRDIYYPVREKILDEGRR